MRFKTSFYIDERIDDSLGLRARRKGTTKSQILQNDLEDLYLCLGMGRTEYRNTLEPTMIEKLKAACTSMGGEKAKAGFVISGELSNDTEDLSKFSKRLSPIARLAILDDSEEQ